VKISRVKPAVFNDRRAALTFIGILLPLAGKEKIQEIFVNIYGDIKHLI
jgi:hypothetical protein